MDGTLTIIDRSGEPFTLARHPDGLAVTLTDCGMNYMTVLPLASVKAVADFLTAFLESETDRV